MCLKFLKYFLLLALLSRSGKAIENDCKQDSKSIFCYYLFDTPQSLFLDAENLPPCTHIIFSFARLDIDGNIKITKHENNSIEEKIQKEIFNIRELNSCVKILLAVGGKDEGGEKFSALAENEEKREKFAETLLKFLIFYGFDGVDLHWMYPTLRGGIPEDTQNFLSLIKSVKQKLVYRKKLVVAALGASSELIDGIYSNHLTEICGALDFALLMTFDYNDKHLTSFGASLRGLKESVEKNVEKFKNFGCDEKKIVVGISSYGKVYKLMRSQNYKVGDKGNFVGEIEYHKICKALKQNSSMIFYKKRNLNEIKAANVSWIKVKGLNNEKFIVNDKTWISYEDHEDVAAKAEFVSTKNLAGLMFFTLNAEDSTNHICGLPYPLLNTAFKNFNKKSLKV